MKSRSWPSQLTTLLWQYKWLLLLLWAVLFVTCVLATPKLKFNMKVGATLDFLDKDSRQKLIQFRKLFRERKWQVVVALEWKHKVGLSEFQSLKRFHEQLARRFPALTISSLSNIKLIERGRFFPIPKTMERLGKKYGFQKELERHPLLSGNYVSFDRSSFLVLIKPKGETQPTKLWKRDVASYIKAKQSPQLRLRLYIDDQIERDMFQYMLNDIKIAALLLSLFLLLTLPFFFTRWHITALMLVLVWSTLFLYWGALIVLGRPMRLYGMAIPGLVLLVTASDIIHMLHVFGEQTMRLNRRDAMEETLRRVGVSCFLTSLTTGVGFFSLFFTGHPALQALAIDGVLGVSIAFLSVILFLPPFLFWMKHTEVRMRPWLSRIPLQTKRVRWVYVVLLVVAGVCISGIPQVKVNNHRLRELPVTSPIHQQYKWHTQKYGGIWKIDMQVKGPICSWGAFQQMEKLQAKLLALPEVGRVRSITSTLREIAGQPASMTAGLLDRACNFLSFAEDKQIAHIINKKRDRARIILHLGDIGMTRELQLRRNIQTLLQKSTSPLQIHLMQGFYKNQVVLLYGMTQNILISMLVTCLFLGLMFRSLTVGGLAFVVNALPLIVALGVSGWFGVQFRPGTLIYYSIGFGLAIDDTIHILSRFMEERQMSPSLPIQAHIDKALHLAGRALLLTSLYITVGAVLFMPSTLPTLQNMAILLSALCGTAFFADVYVLPLMLRAVFSKSKESTSS